MTLRKYTLIILFLFGLLVTLNCAQLTPQNQRGESTVPEGPKITVKGKIGFMPNLGGYFVQGLEPGGELFIVNKNPQVLDGLFKNRKTVMIEGRIVRGAEYLFIEKIDGQPYRGKSDSTQR